MAAAWRSIAPRFAVSTAAGRVATTAPAAAPGSKGFGLGWSDPLDPTLYTDGRSAYVELHAGVAPTFWDQARLAAGETYTTLEIKVNMVRGMSENTGEVRAEGHVLHRGRTTATADGKLTDADGRLLAHAVTTCMIFPAAKA